MHAHAQEIKKCIRTLELKFKYSRHKNINLASRKQIVFVFMQRTKNVFKLKK